MYRLVLLAVMLISVNVSAQTMRGDVTRLLKKKKFSAFEKYTWNSSDGVSHSWKALREIAPGYREVVWVGEEMLFDKKNPDVLLAFLYQVTFIIKDDRIIQYDFIERNFRGATLETVFDTVDSYRNLKALNLMKVAFTKFYGQSLVQDDLFITSLVYGYTCKHVGMILEGRKQMDEWVAGKNKAALVNWLKSANTEKQVYAVEGLMQLQEKDQVVLTAAEQKIISYVKSKEGIMTADLGDCNVTQYFIPNVIQRLEERFKK